MTGAAGVKPTHWYTPTQHSPRDFWRARAWEISDLPNCWQYRTKLSTRTLYTPDHGVNIIVNALGPRRGQIRKFCDDHGILPEFGVFFYTEGEWNIEVYMPRQVVDFCSDIGAWIAVRTLVTDEPKKRKVRK